MAIIEEVLDVEDTSKAAISLESLRVPREFTRLQWETDEETLRALNEWKRRAESTLDNLQSLASTSLHHRHEYVSLVAAFDGDDSFTSEECASLSRQLLHGALQQNDLGSTMSSAEFRLRVLKDILELDIKPLFLPNAHPSVNLDTGRKLPRAAGGPAAAQDLYQDQYWKEHGLGSWNVLRWCASHIEKDDFEALWPLLIPPLMTLLDDYEPVFKIRGAMVVSEMLKHVESGLIKRTGIDVLFSSSLSNAITYMTSPETPWLLTIVVPCYQQLIELTNAEGSEQRFEQLCNLVTSAIIGGAWSYGGNNVATMEASIHVLRPLVRALGLGSARFMKALIPQLSDSLVSRPFAPATPRLQMLSADCLCAVIRECRPRIAYWRHRILDGLLRSWVQLKENNVNLDSSERLVLEESLRELSRELIKSAPTLSKTEIPRLCAISPMFADLFGA